MSDAAFLTAIAAAPADDSLRRDYAEWLIEQSDGRGEFLRLACESISAARGMANLRPHLPEDWVALVDPFPQAFVTYRMPQFDFGETRMPDGNRAVAITQIFVRPGDRVLAGEPLFAVESDGGPGNEAAWDLEASDSGVVMLVLVSAGRWITVGTALAVLLRA